MAGFMLIRHKVKDFASWKAAYEAHLAIRESAGLTQRHLLRSQHDPNEVVLLFEAANLDRAKAFADSSDLKDVMKAAGVVDKPDIHFLNS